MRCLRLSIVFMLVLFTAVVYAGEGEFQGVYLFNDSENGFYLDAFGNAAYPTGEIEEIESGTGPALKFERSGWGSTIELERNLGSEDDSEVFFSFYVKPTGGNETFISKRGFFGNYIFSFGMRAGMLRLKIGGLWLFPGDIYTVPASVSGEIKEGEWQEFGVSLKDTEKGYTHVQIFVDGKPVLGADREGVLMRGRISNRWGTWQLGSSHYFDSFEGEMARFSMSDSAVLTAEDFNKIKAQINSILNVHFDLLVNRGKAIVPFTIADCSGVENQVESGTTVYGNSMESFCSQDDILKLEHIRDNDKIAGVFFPEVGVVKNYSNEAPEEDISHSTHNVVNTLRNERAGLVYRSRYAQIRKEWDKSENHPFLSFLDSLKGPFSNIFPITGNEKGYLDYYNKLDIAETARERRVTEYFDYNGKITSCRDYVYTKYMDYNIALDIISETYDNPLAAFEFFISDNSDNETWRKKTYGRILHNVTSEKELLESSRYLRNFNLSGKDIGNSSGTMSLRSGMTNVDMPSDFNLFPPLEIEETVYYPIAIKVIDFEPIGSFDNPFIAAWYYFGKGMLESAQHAEDIHELETPGEMTQHRHFLHGWEWYKEQHEKSTVREITYDYDSSGGVLDILRVFRIRIDLENSDFDTYRLKRKHLFHLMWLRGLILKDISDCNSAQVQVCLLQWGEMYANDRKIRNIVSSYMTEEEKTAVRQYSEKESLKEFIIQSEDVQEAYKDKKSFDFHLSIKQKFMLLSEVNRRLARLLYNASDELGCIPKAGQSENKVNSMCNWLPEEFNERVRKNIEKKTFPVDNETMDGEIKEEKLTIIQMMQEDYRKCSIATAVKDWDKPFEELRDHRAFKCIKRNSVGQKIDMPVVADYSFDECEYGVEVRKTGKEDLSAQWQMTVDDVLIEKMNEDLYFANAASNVFVTGILSRANDPLLSELNSEKLENMEEKEKTLIRRAAEQSVTYYDTTGGDIFSNPEDVDLFIFGTHGRFVYEGDEYVANSTRECTGGERKRTRNNYFVKCNKDDNLPNRPDSIIDPYEDRDYTRNLDAFEDYLFEYDLNKKYRKIANQFKRVDGVQTDYHSGIVETEDEGTMFKEETFDYVQKGSDDFNAHYGYAYGWGVAGLDRLVDFYKWMKATYGSDFLGFNPENKHMVANLQRVLDGFTKKAVDFSPETPDLEYKHFKEFIMRTVCARNFLKVESEPVGDMLSCIDFLKDPENISEDFKDIAKKYGFYDDGVKLHNVLKEIASDLDPDPVDSYPNPNPAAFIERLYSPQSEIKMILPYLGFDTNDLSKISSWEDVASKRVMLDDLSIDPYLYGYFGAGLTIFGQPFNHESVKEIMDSFEKSKGMGDYQNSDINPDYAKCENCSLIDGWEDTVDLFEAVGYLHMNKSVSIPVPEESSGSMDLEKSTRDFYDNLEERSKGNYFHAHLFVAGKVIFDIDSSIISEAAGNFDGIGNTGSSGDQGNANVVLMSGSDSSDEALDGSGGKRIPGSPKKAGDFGGDKDIKFFGRLAEYNFFGVASIALDAGIFLTYGLETISKFGEINSTVPISFNGKSHNLAVGRFAQGKFMLKPEATSFVRMVGSAKADAFLASAEVSITGEIKPLSLSFPLRAQYAVKAWEDKHFTNKEGKKTPCSEIEGYDPEADYDPFFLNECFEGFKALVKTRTPTFPYLYLNAGLDANIKLLHDAQLYVDANAKILGIKVADTGRVTLFEDTGGGVVDWRTTIFEVPEEYRKIYIEDIMGHIE